jgi:hypothetical protein
MTLLLATRRKPKKAEAKSIKAILSKVASQWSHYESNASELDIRA